MRFFSRYKIFTLLFIIGVVFFNFAMLLVPNPVYAFQPNDFTSQTYQDANGDGSIDRVIVVINGGEALTQCTVDATELASDWTYVGGPTFGGSLASATCDTATATITFTLTGTAALVTGGGTMPTIAYNDNDFDASIRNASGGLMPVTAKNIVDGARPVIISAFTGDNNRDGTIDRLGLMFSESVTVTDGGTDNDITLTASSGTATI
ncbi:hypothetical protein EBT25_09860, partial [bacterium]|nr:hypothetical protein [bacterium]